ncbi:MAG: hypothetical protein HKN33_05830 [Pyrinomonadaceae bacterium]|nr:hypothetical protein [Pyrinomonadaceae bacterium]
MKTLIVIGGVFALGFFVFHVFFWKLFNWKQELSKLSSINRGVMQVLNLCLMWLFLVFGYVSLIHTDELISTPLGKTVLLGIALLWFFRAVEQVVFFKLDSAISVGFFLLFLIGTGLYAVPAFA